MSVARDIVRDIRDLEPGSKLPPEPLLAERYGVARSSLREALRILEAQGLITVRPGPGGGPIVARVDSSDFARMASLYFHLSKATYQDVVNARLVLEPVMARLAAERGDPEANAALEQFVTLGPDVTESPTYLEKATGFHGLLSGLSGNPVLDLFGRSLKDVYTDRLEGVIFPMEARLRVHEDHAAIARAVIKGEAARAEKLMRVHMEEFVQFSIQRNPSVLEDIVNFG
jgi:GntR family transcriptional repressor for pyruvate dehydrogenase complex